MNGSKSKWQTKNYKLKEHKQVLQSAHNHRKQTSQSKTTDTFDLYECFSPEPRPDQSGSLLA